MKHPVTRFDGPPLTEQDHRRGAALIERHSEAEMRALFVKEPRDSIVRAAAYENAASSAVALWVITKEPRWRDLAVSAYRAALGELAGATDESLRGKITDKGSIENLNNYARGLANETDLYAMRDACEHFAMLYHLTREQTYAHKTAVLLARFGEQIPKWPVYFPTRADYATQKAGGNEWGRFKVYPQKGPGMNLNSDATGVWGIWYYEDIQAGMPLARAYDLIYDSGQMQRMGALNSIEQMLRDQVAFQKAFPETFSNMDAVQKDVILTYAEILGEPEWVHEVVWWLKALCKTQFYADGWWHEGSSAYHSQIFWRLPVICRAHLQGYSDPPGFVSGIDGGRFDNLDVLSGMSRQFARSEEVLWRIRQPNNLVQVLHDTHFGQGIYGRPDMKEAKPLLFGCYGHAILGTGRDAGMAQATLHFSGTHGHEHYDCLNLMLFAKGKELISETTYSPMFKNTTREWHTMTAGHATVVVDEKDQLSRGSSACPKRVREPGDDVPGVPDWPWRWIGAGDCMNDGRLRLFNTDFDRVQVVEADGERSYGSLIKLERYRRTVALVKISDADCYVVDIFRVKGGATHDYMLHSCLDAPYMLETSLPAGEPRPGALYKYVTGLRASRADGAWSATFTMEDKSASLKSFVLPQAGVEVIQGTAPAMRREGTAPFIAVRHNGADSVFAVVHHPYSGKLLVEKVELLPLDPAADQAVAIRVTLPGRVDTIISTADEAPWPARTCKAADITLRGRFAHIAEGAQGQSWMYLVDGAELRAGDRALRCDVPLDGALQKTYRVEAGDAFDAFATTTPLPADGSLDGRTLIVDLGGLLVQSFRIQRVERRGETTLIHTSDEPGMTITPGLVKLEYFPCWGIRGEAKFHIASTALEVRR